MSADNYIAGFVATAVTVMLRDAWPRISMGHASAPTALTAVFLCALAWPVWLLVAIAEAADL